MGRGSRSWWATVQGATKSRTWLSDWAQVNKVSEINFNLSGLSLNATSLERSCWITQSALGPHGFTPSPRALFPYCGAVTINCTYKSISSAVLSLSFSFPVIVPTPSIWWLYTKCQMNVLWVNGYTCALTSWGFPSYPVDRSQPPGPRCKTWPSGCYTPHSCTGWCHGWRGCGHR